MTNILRIGLGVLAALTTVHSRALVVDQFNLYPSPAMFSGGGWTIGAGFLGLAQTFTAGRNGTLSAVDIQIAASPFLAAPVPFSLSIAIPDAAGFPPEQVLATVESSFDESISVNLLVPTTVRFDFSSLLVSIEAGAEYVLVMEVAEDAPNAGVWVTEIDRDPFLGGPYAGGRGLVNRADLGWFWPGADGSQLGDVDFAFATYLTPVPAPAALWLFASALGGLFLPRRRRHAVQP